MDSVSDNQDQSTNIIDDDFGTNKSANMVKDEGKMSEILARHRSPKKIPVIAYKNRSQRQSESYCSGQHYRNNNYQQYFQISSQQDQQSSMPLTFQNQQMQQMPASNGQQFQMQVEQTISPLPVQTNNFFNTTDESVDATTAICQNGSSRGNSLARQSHSQQHNSNQKQMKATDQNNTAKQPNNQAFNATPASTNGPANKGQRSASQYDAPKQNKSNNKISKSKRHKRKLTQSFNANVQNQGLNNSMHKKQANSAQVKYKTVLCHHFEQFNSCPIGESCQFAHGKAELRTVNDPLPQDYRTKQQIIMLKSNYKTERCRNMTQFGFCKFGISCCFAHSEEELRTLVDPDPILMPAPLADLKLHSGNCVSENLSRRDSFADLLSQSSQADDIISLEAQDANINNGNGGIVHQDVDNFDIDIQDQDIAVHDFSQPTVSIPMPKIVSCNNTSPPIVEQQTQPPAPQVAATNQQHKRQKSAAKGNPNNMPPPANANAAQSAAAASQRIGAVYNNPMIDMINQNNYQQPVLDSSYVLQQPQAVVQQQLQQQQYSTPMAFAQPQPQMQQPIMMQPNDCAVQYHHMQHQPPVDQMHPNQFQDPQQQQMMMMYPSTAPAQFPQQQNQYDYANNQFAYPQHAQPMAMHPQQMQDQAQQVYNNGSQQQMFDQYGNPINNYGGQDPQQKVDRENNTNSKDKATIEAQKQAQ